MCFCFTFEELKSNSTSNSDCSMALSYAGLLLVDYESQEAKSFTLSFTSYGSPLFEWNLIHGHISVVLLHVVL